MIGEKLKIFKSQYTYLSFLGKAKIVEQEHGTHNQSCLGLILIPHIVNVNILKL